MQRFTTLSIASALLLSIVIAGQACASPLSFVSKGFQIADRASNRATPVASGISGATDDTDETLKEGGKAAASAMATCSIGVATATLHGAGSLAGYAGLASATSSLGLGPAMTMAAGALGSSATGAAATAVVASAVGGPVVLGGILVVGCAATAAGAYKLCSSLWK